MKHNKNTWFCISGSGLVQTDDFQKFCRSGLDSDWKISHSAHLWCTLQKRCLHMTNIGRSKTRYPHHSYIVIRKSTENG